MMELPCAGRPLVLASTSRYRAELLSRLNLPFVQEAPGVDEAELPAEPPAERAARLALAKAAAVAARHPGRWVIGSDQVAASEGRILHKPGTAAANVEQLLALSGKTAQFHTAVALSAHGGCRLRLDCTEVRFREIDRATAQRYVAAEPAQDCAGGFKIEGLGIALFERVDSLDPTALVGLPLIALCELLREAGLALP